MSDDKEEESAPRRRAPPRTSSNTSTGFNSYHHHTMTDSHAHHSGVSCFHSEDYDDDDDQDEDELPLDVMERLVRRTEKNVERILNNSAFIKTNCKLHDLPRLERSHMEIGEMIAHGGFSNVHEILAFHVENPQLSMANNRKYVVKNLNPKLARDTRKLSVGAKDLVMEAHYLSALDHDNIIQLRGWCAAGLEGFTETGRADAFFLIYDMLEETLSRRIANWKNTYTKLKKTRSSAVTNSKEIHDLFQERIKAATDIATACEYLHKNRILYRDLKPANIGFDQSNVLKVFDFGLAVELPADDDPDAIFNLAGNTGTARYMAVEVIRKHPYNFKADVFSFSILLWEIMALQKPYDGIGGQQVKERVAVFDDRPTLKKSWPSQLRKLLDSGWAVSLTDRPHMKQVREMLQEISETAAKEFAK